MSDKNADDVLSDIQFSDYPVKKDQIPHKIRGSDWQKVNDNDLISVLSPVEIVEHKHEYIVKGVDLENRGKKEQHTVKYNQHVEIIDTSFLKP